MLDLIANSPEAQNFKKAVQTSDMKAARKAFKSGDDLHMTYCAKHLIDLRKSRLIELIKGASNEDIKAWMLQVLLVHADRQLINEVLGALNLSDNVLYRVAYSTELACIPRKFTHFLEELVTKRIKNGL